MSDDLDKVSASLNAQIAKLKRRSIDGLMAAGRIIEEGARELVPVHTGELRDSSYTRPTGPDTVEVGFDAPYAKIIHDDEDMKLQGQQRADGYGVYWGPHGTADFLQKSIAQNSERALKAIAEAK